jgi:dTDP-4-dehydrorhamnose 3,5-epimerase
MIFSQTHLAGAFLIHLEKLEDERGFFARSWCRKEAAVHGISTEFVQCNVSYNRKRGTLRGMHYQYPKWEAKLILVTKGSIFDVIVDLRPDSPTYLKHFGVNLNDSDRIMLYVPEGFAHGFMTLEDSTEIFYQMSEYYVPENSSGFRWDDPRFSIPWPDGEKIISQRDLGLPNFEP